MAYGGQEQGQGQGQQLGLRSPPAKAHDERSSPWCPLAALVPPVPHAALAGRTSASALAGVFRGRDRQILRSRSSLRAAAAEPSVELVTSQLGRWWRYGAEGRRSGLPVRSSRLTSLRVRCIIFTQRATEGNNSKGKFSLISCRRSSAFGSQEIQWRSTAAPTGQSAFGRLLRSLPPEILWSSTAAATVIRSGCPLLSCTKPFVTACSGIFGLNSDV